MAFSNTKGRQRRKIIFNMRNLRTLGFVFFVTIEAFKTFGVLIIFVYNQSALF